MKSSLLGVFCLCGLAFAPAAMAAESPAADQAAVVGDSLRVVRDAQSGRLRAPTAEELSEMVSRERPVAAKPLIATTSRNGTKTVRLDESFMVQLNATVDADGKPVTHHAEPGMSHPVAAAAQLPTE